MSKPFGVFGPTYKITADVTAPTAVLVEQKDKSSGKNYSDYRIFNDSDNTIFVSWGSSAADANAAAAEPLTTGSDRVIPMLPKSAEIIRLSQNLFFTGQTPVAASDFYICVGEGV